jgi:hypothetical protein
VKDAANNLLHHLCGLKSRIQQHAGMDSAFQPLQSAEHSEFNTPAAAILIVAAN